MEYIARFIFEHFLGLSFSITTKLSVFQKYPYAKINYSDTAFFFRTIHLIPYSSVLFETGIKKQTIKLENECKLPAFFRTPEPVHNGFQTDIFALAFYLLTRYEEYLPSPRDIHGRFKSQNSIAYKANFLHLPLVDLWILELGKLLQQLFPFLKMTLPKFRFLATYDVDIAWAYRHRTIFRTSAATGYDLLFNRLQLQQRWRVLRYQKKDPFDTFDYIFQQHQQLDLPARFFFLLGDYGKYDKNISSQSLHLQDLIHRIYAAYPIGIHPSYQSNIRFKQLQKEKQRLENIIQQKVIHSRQHFLKLHLPNTYRRLVEVGIQADFTMGYANAIGFRASTAQVFPWFDLAKNEATALSVYPFQVMDVSLKNYLQLTPDEGLQQTQNLIQQCRNVGGQFCFIWHNSSLSTLDGWLDWRMVYEHILLESR